MASGRADARDPSSLHDATAPARPAGYRADIDGLRALAVFAVVAYHAFPEAVPGGFVGVDVFFVISGFLITSILVEDLARGTFTFRGFYIRRVRRLFPALALVLAACLVAGWWLLVPGDYAQLGRHAVASALFVANFAFWLDTDYFAAAAETLPLLHLWSLGIEEQFYLLWPPLLLLAWRWRIGAFRLVATLGLLSLVACLALTAYDATSAFYLPFARFWELLAGAALACFRIAGTDLVRWPARSARSTAEGCAIAGLAAIVAACFTFDAEDAFPGWRALLPVVGTVLLIAAGPCTRVARTLLMPRAIVWIGLISYPLYLWHWPLLSFARIEAAGEVPSGVRVMLVVASVLLAALTYHAVERPLRFRMAPHRALALLLPAMLGIVVAGGALIAMRGFESRAGEPVRAYANYRYPFREASREGLCSLIGEPGEPALFPETCVDPPDARPLVVLWGDSHAAMLYPGLRAVGGDRIRIAQFTRSGCRPFLAAGNDICARSNADVIARIAKMRPDYVILFAHWNHLKFRSGGEMLRQLEPTLAALRELGTRIVVVGPAPKWTGKLPTNLVRLYDERPFLRVPRRTRYGRSEDAFALDAFLRQRLGPRRDLRYVSAIERLCDARGCLTYVGDDPAILTSWDYGHLARPAAEYLVRDIATRSDGFAPRGHVRPETQ